MFISKLQLILRFSGLKNLNLKYQRYTPSGCQAIGIRKNWEKTQFLCQ